MNTFRSPFDERAPHPLAVEAARALQAELGEGQEGKMFGVLVVEKDGVRSTLRAFSGMRDGQWNVPGFVPPLFDADARASFEGGGAKEVARLTAQIDSRAAELARLREALAALKHKHAENRRERQTKRRAGEDAHALDQESRRDKAELRRFPRIDDDLAALKAERAALSAELMRRLFDTYTITNARGEHTPLRRLFAPSEPPSGAGDCAAPKLLQYAINNGYRPVALAEFFWGRAEVRQSGAFYPACERKCGPILRFMLQGIDVEPARPFNDPAPAPVVFEDAWLIAVAKPAGVLSVPGKSDAPVIALPGAQLVHRLDLDTSGVLLAAKDDTTYRAMQRLFAERAVKKRYIAWLDGDIAGERGEITMPLRVDVDDRPRQLPDPVHGYDAHTKWQVIERRDGRARVAFFPHTGRTHQLRVHAAAGLGVPIVGDRLYGRGGERLLLHAEALGFTHPHTGQAIGIESPAPF